MSLVNIEDINKHTIEISLLNNKTKNDISNFGLEEISMPEMIMPEMEKNDMSDCDSFMLNLFKKRDSKLNSKILIKEEKDRKFKNKLKDLIQFKSTINIAWEAIKKFCQEVIDDIVNSYKNIISYFDGEFVGIKNTFKSLKKSTNKEDKANKRLKLKNQFKKFGGELLEIFGINQIYYGIKDIWNILKNIWGTSKETWNNIINNFKELKNLFSDSNSTLGQKIYNWTVTIIKMLASLAIPVLCAIEYSKKEQIKNDDTTKKCISFINDTNMIVNNNNSYLLSRYNNQNIEEEINNDSSIISICPIEYDDTSLSDDLIGYIIEIGMDINNFHINKNNNDDIAINEVIGYIDNKPIKSKIEGKIIEKGDRYLIVETKDDIETSINVSNIDDSNKEINDIIESFNNLNKIETLIKEDLCYVYKPIFVKNNILSKKTNVKKISSDDKYEDFLNNYSKEVSLLEKNIKEKTNSNNVRKILNENPNKLVNLKDEILSIKSNFFNKVISSLFSNYTTYNSSIEENYKLLDYYYQFLYNFNYDSENAFKVELYDMIFNFFQDRKKIESFNEDKIKKEINKLALEIQNENNFYNFILPNIKNLNNVNDIYKLVKNICNIENSFQQIEIDTSNINEDYINNILNNQQNNVELSEDDKNKIKKDKIAKKIAIMLHLLSYDNIDKINDKKTLKEQTNYECNILINYFSSVSTKYNTFIKQTNEIYNLSGDVQWPIDSVIYINNKKYIHYLFYQEKNDNNDNIINGEDPLSTNTQYESNTYMYWLKYCGIATLLNCALPMYWGTGLLIAGVPTPLPIILIPIYVIKGSCICVIGLGICGLAIYPMLLYSNISEETMSYFIPVNLTIDLLKNMIKMTKEKSKTSIKQQFNANIQIYDSLIKKTNKEIESINKEIEIVKNL